MGCSTCSICSTHSMYSSFAMLTINSGRVSKDWTCNSPKLVRSYYRMLKACSTHRREGCSSVIGFPLVIADSERDMQGIEHEPLGWHTSTLTFVLQEVRWQSCEIICHQMIKIKLTWHLMTGNYICWQKMTVNINISKRFKIIE